MRNKVHGTALALSLLFLLSTATACSSDSSDSTDSSTATDLGEVATEVATDADTETDGEEVASTDGLTFVITLYPEYAPITCENFENLVSEGFYDGLTFHRIVEDFMAQGGDPEGNGTGGSDETIKGEFSDNGVDNPLSHTRGVVSMARSTDPDSASSQFFICYTDDCTFLDGQYAAFGKVTEGMDVIDSFLNVSRSMGSDGAMSSPNTPIVIDHAIMIEADEDGNPRAQFTMQEFGE
jgi:peptidyl-prolyl cis-trans isomerase B (cyclophilin B)